MQFVMFVYHGTTPIPGTPGWSALSDAEQKAIYADYAALNRTPGLTPGLALGRSADAILVTVKDGDVIRAQGEPGGGGESVAGYFVLEAESLEQAIEVAARIPSARLGGAVEVRPSSKYW